MIVQAHNSVAQKNKFLGTKAADYLMLSIQYMNRFYINTPCIFSCMFLRYIYDGVSCYCIYAADCLIC